MTTLTMLPQQQNDASAQPVPWRQMGWVIWRQHRFALGGVAAIAGGLAVWMWVVGLRLHHAYALATACRPASSIACGELVNNFDGMGQVFTNGYLLQALPALIGAFAGAPLLAREMETGTFRFAWTQGFGPWRWALAKLVALGALVAVLSGAVTMLFSWYYQPYLQTGNQALTLTELSPLSPNQFVLRGFAFATWTLLAFAIGGLAGIVLRRVVFAIVTTLAIYAALAVAAGAYLREHYLAPIVTSNPSRWVSPGSAWVLSQHWTAKGGQSVSLSALGHVLQSEPLLAGKGGVPKALGSVRYLMHLGYTLWTSYQPANRFWPFQLIEAGWLLALSALLIAATVWLVRRRPI